VAEPCADERAKARGDRQRLVKRRLAAMLLDRPPELEREEGVAAGGLVEAHQRWARHAHPKTQPEKLMESGEGERPEAEPLRWEPGLERDRGWLAIGETDSREHANRLSHQTAEGEGKDSRRGLVEPLGIVDRDEQRAATGERAEDVQEGKPDRPLVWRLPFRLGEEERRLERPPLRRGNSGQRVLECAGEEVAERGEGELHLRAGGPAGKRPLPTRPGAGKARLPEHRLPDSHLALEHKGARASREPREKPAELGELLLPADQLLDCVHGPPPAS
jgi:hypothetical protein